MKQSKNILLRATFGAVALGSLAGASFAMADGSPFATQSLDSGYAQVAAAAPEGRCGEGRCGGAAEEGKDGEGKCGEGRCGGDAAGGHDGKKDGEGKCGEGRCGGAG